MVLEKPLNQTIKFKQVAKTEQCPVASRGDFAIRFNHIRPRFRYRTDAVLVYFE